METMIYTLDNIREIHRKRGSPVIKQLVRGNTVMEYRLMVPLKLELSNGDILTIPGGFIWDLSSVPRAMWSLLPPDGEFEIGTIIHDYLYKNKLYTRKFADKEMLLWANAVSGTKAKISMRNIDNWVRYLGVVLFGWTKRGNW